MEDCINSVTLLGRVDGEPKLGTAGSTPVLKFKVETVESFRGRDGSSKEKRARNFVAVFGAKANETTVQNGDRVLVQGSLSISKSQDGRFFTEVSARLVVVFGEGIGSPDAPAVAPQSEDGLPF